MTPSPPALRLEPRPSRCLARAWFGLHGLALCAVWIAELPPAVGLSAASLILAGGAFGWRQHRGVGGCVLTWTADGIWTLELPAAAAIACRRWSAPWVHPRLVLLRLGLAPWRWRTFALCADSLPPDEHRELRVRLRVYSTRRRGA